MKRMLLTATLSALVLAFFALPSGADPVAPAGGETEPVVSEEASPTTAPPDGETLLPTTTYEACIAAASNPETCDGGAVAPPDVCLTDRESPQLSEFCEANNTVGVDQAAAMRAAEAATEAVEDGPGDVDAAAAYSAALGAARDAAENAGADAETAGIVAEAAAETTADAIAREAATDAAAVDGAAAYIAALNAAREAEVGKEAAPVTANRTGATVVPDTAPASREAGSLEGEAGISEYAEYKASAVKNETQDAEGGAVAEDERAAPAAAPVADDGGAASAAENVLPAVEGASPLMLEGGALLVAAGVVGLLILRRRIAL